MILWEFGDLFLHICDGVEHVFAVETIEGIVGLHCVVEFAENAVIIDDIAKVFAFKETIDTRNRL